MCSKLVYNFNRNDKSYIIKEDIIQADPYIGNWLNTTAIYDENNNKIGYSSSNSYVQEESDGKYLVRHFLTFFITGKGSISWQYSSVNDRPIPYYQPGINVKARITSGTGDYVRSNGFINIIPKEDGSRKIVISYKS
jgi:hypothetical protein